MARTMSRARGVLVVWIQALCCVSCAVNPSSGSGRAAKGSPTLALSTYYEEGSQAAVVVGVRPALSRRDRPYIPVEVAVVNKGLAALTLTAESFLLVDTDGRSFPTVTAQELSRGYGSTDVDRRLGEIEPIVQNRYQTFERVPSNFTPGFDTPIGRDRVTLHRFSYLVDMVYFPNPAVPTPAAPYDLLVRAPELQDPLVVRFIVGRAR